MKIYGRNSMEGRRMQKYAEEQENTTMPGAPPINNTRNIKKQQKQTIKVAAYITFTHPNTSSESSQTVMNTMPMDSGTQNLQKPTYANNKHNTNKCHKRKLIASQRKHQNATTTHM